MSFLGAGILLAAFVAAWLAYEFWTAPIVDESSRAPDDEFAWGVWIGMDTWTPHERRHEGAR